MHVQSTRATKRGAPTIPRECRQCGAAFLTWRYVVEQGKGNYCSPACFLSRPREQKAERAQTILHCTLCEQPFTVWRYRAGTAKYCSERCQWAAKNRGAARDCARCGRSFYATASRQRLQDPQYCSKRCHAAAVKAADHPSRTRNSAKNRAWRIAVKVRDGYRCQRCGSSDGLHAHHVRGWHQYTALRFDLGNGITLCRRCHGTEHAGTRMVA
jgi:hypothetical protein